MPHTEPLPDWTGPFWRAIWAALMATPGDRVLTHISALYLRRRDPNARELLKLWIVVHRAQEAVS